MTTQEKLNKLNKALTKAKKRRRKTRMPELWDEAIKDLEDRIRDLRDDLLLDRLTLKKEKS